MMRLGIDLGGTATKLGLVTDNGYISAVHAFPTPIQQGANEVMRQIAQQCDALCRENAVPVRQLGGIGFGAPGFVDRENATVLYSANLHFRNVSIRSLFGRYFPDIPILVENDANCAAIAEAVYGAAQDTQSSVTLTLGTGVGAGVILNRQIFSGQSALAPEIGHLIIVADGEPCSCGRKGCMERYISATALIQQTERACARHPKSLLAELACEGPISAKTAFSAAAQGDATAQQVVDNYIRYLAISISNIIYCYGPEIVLLGGGICNEGDRLLDPLRVQLDSLLMPSSRGQTRLALAQFRNDAGLLGSTALFSLS